MTTHENGDQTVNAVGKTQLKGHALLHEGQPRFDSAGDPVISWWAFYGRRAKCTCGALSEPGISTYRARRWHREHKDSLR